jgi:hypothetical protein
VPTGSRTRRLRRESTPRRSASDASEPAAPVEARGSAREPNHEARGSAREPNHEARGSAREPNDQLSAQLKAPPRTLPGVTPPPEPEPEPPRSPGSTQLPSGAQARPLAQARAPLALQATQRSSAHNKPSQSAAL